MIKKNIYSLDKNHSADIFFKKPDKYKDIEIISSKFDNIITMGSCNSYTPASFKKDALSIQLTKFDRIIEFNENQKLITVEAGIKLSDLFNFTLSRGLWVPQIPGYPTITIGGAIASNSHGKSCGYHGTIKKQIKKIKIFHKMHGWLNLSNEENKDIFELTIGGLGLTGSIIEVQLKLEELKGNNFVTKIIETNSSNDTVKKINFDSKKEIYCYSWNRSDSFKNFGKGFVFQNQLNVSSNNKFPKNIRLNNSDINNNFIINCWNKYSISFTQSIYQNYFKYFKSKQHEESFQKAIFPFIGKEFYFQLFGKKGFLESQIIVPFDKTEIFIDEVENIFKKYDPKMTLYSLKNFKGDQKYLRFENDGICFTFDFVKNSKNILFLNELDKICEKYHLTPSIIKDSRLKLETVEKCYKDFYRFREEINKFDNKRIYKSALSDKLMI